MGKSASHATSGAQAANLNEHWLLYEREPVPIRRIIGQWVSFR